MDSLFSKKKTPTEQLRQHQRSLIKAQRELDRERERLERQEWKLIVDIKNSAKENQMSSCKIKAKDLVRIRRNVQKFYQIKTQLQAVSLHMQTLSSSHQMAEAMKGVSKAMSSMNKQMNPSQIQKIMMDFEKESEVMDMKDDMMSDAIDDAMEEGDEDQVLSNVLDEIGVSFNQELGQVPTGIKQIPVSTEEKVERDATLQARWDN